MPIGKKHLQVKHEYEHLDSWYIKSTVYKEVLKLKQHFQKNKAVTGKTPFFVKGPFCTPYSNLS